MLFQKLFASLSYPVVRVNDFLDGRVLNLAVFPPKKAETGGSLAQFCVRIPAGDHRTHELRRSQIPATMQNGPLSGSNPSPEAEKEGHQMQTQKIQFNPKAVLCFAGVTLLMLGFSVGALTTMLTTPSDLQAASASGNDKFSMATVPTELPNISEAVFVLDHLTGNLRGGVLSDQTGKFAFTYFRNVAADFQVNPATPDPKYAIVAGPMDARGAGGAQPAKGVVFVGELTSGSVIAYGFAQPRGRGSAVPLELVPLDRLVYREAVGG